MTLLQRLKMIADFILRRDNPNQVTAEQAGAYTKEDIDDKLETKIPNGILPIYAFGTSDNTPIAFIIAGTRLTITSAQPVLLYGTPYTLASGSLDAAAFPNTTSYIVVELISGIPQYSLLANKPKDTNTRINIGTVTRPSSGAMTAVINKVRGIIASEAI